MPEHRTGLRGAAAIQTLRGCASGPASPIRSARRTTAPAPTSRSSPRSRAVELCLFDDDGNETRVDAAGDDGVLLARLPRRTSARASATATASTGRGSRTTGQRCNPAKLLLDPYAQGRRRPVAVERGASSPTTSTTRRARRTTPTARRSCRSRSSPTRTSTGATTAGRARRGTRRSSTRCTSRASRSAIPSVPEELRGTYAGLAHPGRRSSTCKTLGVTAVELLPVHQFVHDSHAARAAGCATTGATTRSAIFAPHNEYSARGAARRAGAGVQADGEGAARARASRCILDVVYNHTAEGNHLGPMLSFKGIDNAAYYRLVADEPPLLHGLHRAPATRSTCGTRTCCS